MGFNMKQFFMDIFKPIPGEERIMVLYDTPHDRIKDNRDWEERRLMAERWHRAIDQFKNSLNLELLPIVTYAATGTHNGNLPETCRVGNLDRNFLKEIENATIIIAMTEYSATAPLYLIAKKLSRLRVGSMPGVAPFMEDTGLSADYLKLNGIGKKLAPLFENASAADVTFSSGETCRFDLSRKNIVYVDDGNLPPENAGTDYCLSNLPAGEVCCVPNEGSDSQTRGKLPVQIGEHKLVLTIEQNRIGQIEGNTEAAAELTSIFDVDPARRNIAEFAIGINDRATVTGNVLQDEKAGFHWAYGRSDHLGGTVGVDAFRSPDTVEHTDIVYAKGNPIVAERIDLIQDDGSIVTVMKKGELIL